MQTINAIDNIATPGNAASGNAASGNAAPANAASADPAAEKVMVILVVDDDESNRESLRRRLARHGHGVTTAADGPSALELIERQSFDLVLLDVMMPGMSGLEVLKRVRQTRSQTDLPIIMATAMDESKDIVAALDSGANDYVTKPLDFGVVLARVRTQLLLKSSVDRILDLERHLSSRNADLEAANARLKEYADRTAQELEAAARVQKTFLPSPAPKLAGSTFAWVFEPCQELAGDSLNILQLDADHVAFYVLDVSGHGVAAALLAFAATRLLSEVGYGDSIVMRSRDGRMTPVQPAEVAATLDKRFTWNNGNNQFMTLFYAVFNSKTQVLSYVSAGHPGAIHIPRGKEPRILDGTGLPIGLGEAYEQQTVRLDPGDRLYLYSDGVTETMNPQEDLFGPERLMAALQESVLKTLAESVAALQARVLEWQEGGATKDDISVLAVEYG